MRKLKEIEIWYFARIYKLKQNSFFSFIIDWLLIPFVISYKEIFSNKPFHLKILMFFIALILWWVAMEFYLKKRIQKKLKHYYDLYQTKNR